MQLIVNFREKRHSYFKLLFSSFLLLNYNYDIWQYIIKKSKLVWVILVEIYYIYIIINVLCWCLTSLNFYYTPCSPFITNSLKTRESQGVRGGQYCPWVKGHVWDTHVHPLRMSKGLTARWASIQSCHMSTYQFKISVIFSDYICYVLIQPTSPEGRLGISDVSPLSGISGLSGWSYYSIYNLLFCSSAYA